MRRHLKQITPARTLVTILILGVLGYHGVGLFSKTTPQVGWVPSVIRATVQRANETRTVAQVTVRVATPFRDGGSQALGDVGYLVRYFTELLSEGYYVRGTHVYLRDEVLFQFKEAWPRVQREFLPGFRKAATALGEAPAKILLVLGPPKISVEGEWAKPLAQSDLYHPLSGGELAPRATYEQVLASVGDSLMTVDLLREFESYRAAQPDALLFPPHDQHWSSLGTALVAKAIVNRLRAEGKEWESPQLRYRRLLSTSRREGFRAPGFSFVPDWFAAREARKLDREPLYDLLPMPSAASESGRVILWGTSFSDRLYGTGYSLGEVLARALGRPLIQVAMPGGGAHGGLEAFGKSLNEIAAGDIVVWEFPLAQVLGHFNQSSRLPELAIKALAPRPPSNL